MYGAMRQWDEITAVVWMDSFTGWSRSRIYNITAGIVSVLGTAPGTHVCF